jgi:hypoxia up-regulated 1
VVFRHDSDTAYSVEELLGLLFAHAKTQAESFTEQAVKDAVITTPVYFNQAERLALVAAVQLGGLNVLQLMNVPMAVALNYGMFRRKEINGTLKHLMLYNMGAQATTATIVGFQVVKTKGKGFSETHPQAHVVLGVGYDRTLGGAEIRFRVRDYLADQFNALGKTKTDVKTVPRAMGKLLKEAERVKLILSANAYCYAQIENVMEDIYFKVPMSRDKLMELSTDLMDRVTGQVERALTTASMSMENIEH